MKTLLLVLVLLVLALAACGNSEPHGAEARCAVADAEQALAEFYKQHRFITAHRNIVARRHHYTGPGNAMSACMWFMRAEIWAQGGWANRSYLLSWHDNVYRIWSPQTQTHLYKGRITSK